MAVTHEDQQGDLFAPQTLVDPPERRRREQTRAIGAPTAIHLRIIAGPGAGKTHVLTERVRHLVKSGLEPEDIAVVTYTNSARSELEDRLASAAWWREGRRPFVGTIHQFCGLLVRRDPGAAGLAGAPRMLDEHAARRMFSIFGAGSGRAAAETLDGWQLALNSWDGRGPDPLLEQRRDWDRFCEQLRERRLSTFTTIQLWALAAIDAGRQPLPAQILVDEFQDSAGLQVRVLEALAAHGCWISVVGDPDQSIFRFAGGDPGQLPAFHRRFVPCFSCTLSANGRSTAQLVEFASRMRAGEPQFALSGGGPPPALWHLNGERQQAVEVASEIARLCGGAGAEGVAPEEVAVLFREGAPAMLVDELEQRDIPFWLPRTERFEAKDHIRSLIVTLEWLADPEDEQTGFFFFDAVLRGGPKTWEQVLAERAAGGTLAAAVEAAGKKVARPRQASLRQWLACRATLLALPTDLPGDDLARAVYERVLAPRADLRQRQRFAEIESDLERIGGLARDCDGPGELAALLRQGRLPDEPPGRGVTLGTLHWAKGRQWPVVFLIDLTQGVLPHRRAADTAEERRLLYVGVSRAGRRLVLCAPERLAGRGEGPSPFLSALADGCRVRDLRSP